LKIEEMFMSTYKKFLLLLFAMLFGGVAQFSIFNFQFSIYEVSAQNSKRVKDLKNQKARLQQDLKKSKADLEKTRQNVKKGQQNIQYLGQEIEVRVR